MLKQIWTIRSLRMLIWGLSFAASLVALGYAALCCFVLGDEVPWRPAPDGVFLVSRWRLLVLPAVSLLLCIVLWVDSKRGELPRFLRFLAAKRDTARRRQLALFLDAEAGTCFLGVLWFFLRSMQQTSFAKGVQALPSFTLWLVPLALVLWWGVAWVRLWRAGQTK